MKIFKKFSLFVALIITTVALAPAMPDAHAAGSLIFTNSDTIPYLDINISYSSDSLIDDTNSIDVVEPSDPLLCGEILTVPVIASFDENFDIILIDNNGTTFVFCGFEKTLADTNASFEIIYDADTQMALKVSAPGFKAETFWPDAIL